MLHYLPGNLKKYRILKNLTQENVAEYIRITPQSVSKWERGGLKIKDTTLKPTLTLLPNNTILEVNPMKKLISCEYNFDNCCAELKFTDGSMIAIDTIAVESEVARNMYERPELDYLICNAPLEYANLILNGDPELYLKTVTEYKPLD